MGMFTRIVTTVKGKADDIQRKREIEQIREKERKELYQNELHAARTQEAKRLAKEQAKIETNKKLQQLKTGKGGGPGFRQIAGNIADNYSKSFERDLGMLGGGKKGKRTDTGLGGIKPLDFDIGLKPRKRR